MRARLRGTLILAWPTTLLAAITVAATLMGKPSAANAVEYVRVCDLYGDRFLYIPGTDTCLNVATNDARTQTSGGTWFSLGATNPPTWVTTPAQGCPTGSLVKLSDVTGNNLVENAYSRYQTKKPYQLLPGQYVSSVLYQGGFTGVGDGNFCMYYYNPSNIPPYQPFGCINTATQVGAPETLVFSPDRQIPLANNNATTIVGANGEVWDIGSLSQVEGTLSIWLCLQQEPINVSIPH